jgi:outer membrane protein
MHLNCLPKGDGVKAICGLVFAALIVVCLLNGCNAEAPKIAVVNLGRVISESQEGKKANAELDALVKEKRAAAAQKVEEIDKLKKGLDKEPAATRKNKEDELGRMIADYQKMMAASESEARTKAAELKAGLLKEIKNVTDGIGSEDKYTLILSTENAPYYQKTIDLTDKVIMRYNELQGTK